MYFRWSLVVVYPTVCKLLCLQKDKTLSIPVATNAKLTHAALLILRHEEMTTPLATLYLQKLVELKYSTFAAHVSLRQSTTLNRLESRDYSNLTYLTTLVKNRLLGH
jgi:hypothetical protein